MQETMFFAIFLNALIFALMLDTFGDGDEAVVSLLQRLVLYKKESSFSKYN